MPTYVVLLRGVNVGKGSRVPMADFRSLLEAQGCKAVRTVLNSGNALCDSPGRSASALGTRIHLALHRELGLDVQVVVKTATEFATVVAEQSIEAPAEHHSRLLVLFAQDRGTIRDLSAMSPLVRAPERLIVGREAAYLWCPDGILQSSAANASVGKASRALTTRNWATVLKLEALLHERAKQTRSRQESPASVDEYIAACPPEVQDVLQQIRQVVRDAAPGAVERISYRMPAFKQHGFLVYFAAFKEHVGFFPPIRGDARLEKTLAPYAGAKGNLRFPLDQPMPLELIRRLTLLRVSQDRAKAQAKATTTDKTRRDRPGSRATKRKRGHGET